MKNLNSKPFENRLFVLNHWIAPNLKDVYVMHGSIENLDKSDYQDSKTRDVHFVQEYVHLTDTIETVKYKIAKYCLKNKDIKNLYMWSKCIMTTNDKYNFLINLFKKEIKLSREHINRFTRVFFNKKYYEDELDNKELIEDIDNKINSPYIERSIDFVYSTIHDTDYLLSPNPFHNVKEDIDMSALSRTTFMKSMLFRFKLYKNEINFISKDTEKDVDSVYFDNTNIYDKSYEILMENKMNIQSKLLDMNTMLDNMNKRIEVLYFRVLPYSHDIKINMKTLFSISNTSYEIPYIIYKSKFTSMYKVNKVALSDMDKKQINMLYEQEVKYQNSTTTRANDTIIYYIKLSSNVFFYMLLSENGSYRVKFKFNKAHDYKLENIYECFDILKDIYKELDEFSIYKLTSETELFNSKMIDIIEYNTQNTITFKHEISEDILNKNVRKNNPFFEYIKVMKNSVIQLQYVDTNNFYNTDSITSFIYNHYELSKNELIDKLAFYFKMSTEDAKVAYEEKKNKINLNITKKGNNIFAVRNYHTAVSVKLNILSNYSIKVNTVNTQDSIYQDCILYYLMNYLSKKIVDKDVAVKKTTDDVSSSSDQGNDSVNFNDLIDVDDFDIDLDDMNDLGIDLGSPSLNIETDFGNVFDEDIYSDNIELEDAGLNEDNATTEGQLINESGKKTDYTTFVLDKLYRADRKLFLWKNVSTNLKNYSSKCGAVNFRQPIVINKEEKDNIDKNHPGSYTGYVKTGSTPELKEKNFYICPKIWCRVSRVSITEEEYKKNGNRCPDPYNEEAMFFPKKGSKTNYFITKDGTEEHWPSLLKKNKHPLNLELPCCGKKPFNLEEKDKNSSSNYIANISSELLLDSNEYGNLPHTLNKILNNKAVCTGILDSKTQCYVRTGVNNTTQVLFTILEKLLKIKDIRRHIANHMKIEEYIFLNGGNTLKVFMNNEEQYRIMDKKEFKKFKMYFLANEEYAIRFNLNKEYEYVKNNDVLVMKNDSLTKSIIREYLILNSFINFKNYILHKDIPKHLDYLMHMLTFKWLNPEQINFIFLNVDKDDVYFINPKYYNFNDYYDPSKRTAIVLKLSSGYEYVSYIAQKKFADSTKGIHFPSSVVEPLLLNILKKKTEAKDVFLYDPKVECYVLSMNMKCIGILLDDSYVPLSEETILDYNKIDGKKVMYGSCLKELKIKKSVLNKYGVNATQESIKSSVQDDEKTNMDLFVQEWNATRYESPEQTLYDENLFNVAKKIKQKDKLVNAVYVLNSSMNNFSMEEKKTLLKKILLQYKVHYAKEVNEDELLRDIIMIPITKIMNDYKLKIQRVNNIDLLITYDDLMNKKLEDYYERYKNNKFQIFDKSIEDFVYDVEKIVDAHDSKGNNIVWTLNRKDIKPKTLQDKIPNFVVVDEEITFAKLINFANDLDKSITLEKFEEKLTERIMNIYTKDNNSGKAELFDMYNRNLNFARHKLSKKNATIDDYISLISSKDYFYSIFELEVFAKLIKTNIIIVGRDTNLAPGGVVLVKVATSKRYIILMYTIADKRHIYNLVVNRTGEMKEIFSYSEIKNDFADFIVDF